MQFNMFSIELHKSLFKKKKLEEPEPHPCALEQHPISPTPKFVVKILNLSRIVEESTNPREKRHFYRNNTSPPNLHSPSFKPYKVTSFLFYLSQLRLPAHLLHARTDVTGVRAGFGEERRPGREVLLELGVGLLVAAVAAAGGASPGPLEGRGLLRAAGRVCHAEYRGEGGDDDGELNKRRDG